ncbi:hypothetical protein M885DRAFT_538263 [Pelagophyceae sp. CCMP2097]|nr:hypothetical protein M885DRAFT_538263 [Pelagophyceae sp. CCMP2097]
MRAPTAAAALLRIWCFAAAAETASGLAAVPRRLLRANAGVSHPPLLSGGSGGDADVTDARLSKSAMLKFYGPALGIFLAGPLMSNIDNAVVGRVAGVSALAALSPGTVLADQILFLFSFLGRATTGLVSRAYAEEGVEGARRVLRRPLALSFAIGAGVLVPLYVFCTPAALRWLGVDASLRPDATAYAVIRGLAAPLALCQSVALSGLLAMRDAGTPLKVVAASSLLNLVGDLLLCVWPWRFGPAGAAAATSLSTALGAVLMLDALRKRGLLVSTDETSWWRDYFLPPRARRQELTPKALKAELKPLATYAGPLSAIVLARLVGLAAMQRTAAAFGVAALAAYQVVLNGFVLFAFFAEPLSQTAQSLMPTLLDGPVANLRLALRNLATLAVSIAPLIALGCAGFLYVCAPAFTGDAAAIALVRRTAIPAVFLAVAQLTLTTTLDGCLVGSRDFRWIVATGTCTCLLQLSLLRAISFRAATLTPVFALSAIFATYTLRLATYAAVSGTRVATGRGPLGRALRRVEARRVNTDA